MSKKALVPVNVLASGTIPTGRYAQVLSGKPQHQCLQQKASSTSGQRMTYLGKR
jgi:hypothetical protein